MIAGGDPVGVGLAVTDLLEDAGFPSALGGSIALGLWGVPRATKDADINVFVGPDRHSALQALLERAGCGPAPERSEWSASDRDTFIAAANDGDVAVIYAGETRVDIFVPSIPFYDDAQRTVRRLPHPRGRPVPVLSPEALCVFKLLFFRDKDLVDLRRLVARQQSALDSAWVRARLADMFPGGDDRLVAWDAIVREHGGA